MSGDTGILEYVFYCIGRCSFDRAKEISVSRILSRKPAFVTSAQKITVVALGKGGESCREESTRLDTRIKPADGFIRTIKRSRKDVLQLVFPYPNAEQP